MLAFLMKILLCLLIAAAIGFVMAWLLRGLAMTRLREHNYRLTSDLAASGNQLLAAQQQNQEYRGKLSLLERDLANASTRNTELVTTLNSEQKRLSGLTEELRLERERVLALEGIAKERLGELETLNTRFSTSLRDKDSEISRLGQQLAPLVALPASLAASEGQVKALQLKLDEAVAARHTVDSELAGLRGVFDTTRRETDEELARRADRIGQLERALDAERQKLGASELILARQNSEQSGMRERLSLLESEARVHSERLAAATRDKEQQIAQLTAKLAPLVALPAALSARNQEFQALEKQLSDLRSRGDGELNQLKGRVAAMTTDMQSRDSTVATLRVELDAARKTLESRSALLRDAEAARTSAEAAARSKDAELARLRAELSLRPAAAAANIAPRQFASAPGVIDDLKHIYGVGPALEKVLNGLGVYQFRQVALWNAEDIAFFDAKLTDFHGRIERENWVRSAQEEHYKKYREWLGPGTPAITMPETNR